ncbi:hypothetical protein BTVI_73237 [Pitangus sulphuratus]|nr:hypothetical protein BTVI_73237 [Pitangus sulphuratus]
MAVILTPLTTYNKEFLSQVFRHGEHTPEELFPTDMHKEILRQQGHGQLTKIYVQSTDCDHTLMSAQASLAGLYPLTQDQIWNPRILWQPIPVHTVPLSHDNLLYLPFSHCPKYKELLRETFTTRDFQRQLKHYKDINNYTLPVWATRGVRTKLTKLSELLLQAEFGFHKQTQKSRLQGGILLKTILKHISNARNSSHRQKMVMYSAHAATIAALQTALNVFNGKLPPYSACHFFELYQERNGQYTIEMYYRNNSLRNPHPLTLPGCKFRCPLERFTQLVSPVLVRYWTKEWDSTTAERELKFVLVVFRHGDRTPIVNFPTDLHKESEWPQGFGQLTKTGMQQLFELGQYMRKRYSTFLNSTYNRQEFYIQSTDYDRTIMSAQSYLSGLFPPTSSQIWNPELLWQPIPVHIFQKSTERRLNFPLPDCPRFDELQNETQTSTEFQNRIQPYMGIHNYTLPVWATKDVIDKMEKLAELSLLSLFGLYKTEEKSRLQGGVLVNIILNSIKQAANSSKPRKMEVYSAHDTTVGALQIALNIFNGKLPPYAACQIFELYQESSGQVSSYLCKNKKCLEFVSPFPKIIFLSNIVRRYNFDLDGYFSEQSIGTKYTKTKKKYRRYSIEMHYRNDTSKDPYLLTLPGCTSSCPLEKFAELVSPVITENWSKECGKKDKVRDIFIGFDVAIGLLFTFNLVLLYLLYHYGRCRHRSNYQDI